MGCLRPVLTFARPVTRSSVISRRSKPSTPWRVSAGSSSSGGASAMRSRLPFAAVATLDHLSADQRAIIELVLQQQQTYEDLSKVLDTPTSRVRELARDALVELAPVSAERVDADWRGQVADYLLNQQSGPEATATRGHLKRSEPARVWAVSLVDSLDSLYANGTQPKIPEADPSAAGKARRESRRPPRERDAGP